MNLLQLAQRVKREGGRTNSSASPAALVGASGSDGMIFDWVNEAWLEIQRMTGKNWKWMRATALFDTVANQLAYTAAQMGVASTFRKLVRESDDYKVTSYLASNSDSEWSLKWLPYEHFKARFLIGGHTAGAPQYWTDNLDGTIIIGPKPDQVYKVRADIMTKPVSLAADADTPAMPEDHHMMIVWGAVKHLAEFDAAPEVFSRAQQRYEDMEISLIRDQAERPYIGARPLA